MQICLNNNSGIYNKYGSYLQHDQSLLLGKKYKSFSSKLYAGRIHRDVQFTQDGGQVFYAAGGIIRW